MFARAGLTDADVSEISQKHRKNKLIASKSNVMCMSLVTGMILRMRAHLKQKLNNKVKF